jgi:hypothetical protein
MRVLEDSREKRSGEINYPRSNQRDLSPDRDLSLPKGGAPAIPLEEMQLISKRQELRVLHRDAEASDPNMQEAPCLHCEENTAPRKMDRNRRPGRKRIEKM